MHEKTASEARAAVIIQARSRGAASRKIVAERIDLVAAQKERATLEETTTQLKKLRSLRIQVARDPACAAAIPSTRRLEATFPLPDRRGITSAPYDPHQASFAAACASSSSAAAAAAPTVDTVSGMLSQLRSA